MANEVLIYPTRPFPFIPCSILIPYILLTNALQLPSTIPGQGSALRPVRADRERGPLLPFEELFNDNTSNACKQEKICNNVASCDTALPTHSFIHVTSRKKSQARKRSLPTVGYMFWITHILQILGRNTCNSFTCRKVPS